MKTSWTSLGEGPRWQLYRTARKNYALYLLFVNLLTFLVLITARTGVFDNWVFWVGSWKLGIGFAVLFVLLWSFGSFLGDATHVYPYSKDRPNLSFGITLGLFLASIVILFAGSIPATTSEHYISEEHQLTAAANHPGTQTNGAIFVSITTTTEDTTGTLHYIRLETTNDGRQAKTLHTWPMDEIKIFEDATTPVEKHHHTRQIATNPYTGEQEVLSDHLDYVEISIPPGSVANNYIIDVAPNS